MVSMGCGLTQLFAKKDGVISTEMTVMTIILSVQNVLMIVRRILMDTYNAKFYIRIPDDDEEDLDDFDWDI